MDKFDILKMIETIYIARHGMNKHYLSIATSNISIKAIGWIGLLLIGKTHLPLFLYIIPILYLGRV